VELLVLVFVLSTSLILFVAGAEHAARQANLRSRLRMQQLLGLRAVRSVSVGLPVLELLAASGCFWSVATSSRSGLVVSLVAQTALYWSFAGYLMMVLRAGNAGVPCGCGPAEVPVGRSATARATGLGVLSCASAVSVTAFDLGPLTVRADARGLLACVAGLTLAILLVILAPTRRLEPLPASHRVPGNGDPSSTDKTPDPVMIGSA
jgi:hypothetical protein